MCTVTFIAAKNGYRLGMNRDEKRTRVRGLPPAKRTIDGREVICPSEPRGGTWIAVNDAAVCFALINWYSVPKKVQANPASRGIVVNAVSGTLSESDADSALAALPLQRINPFRLIGVFPGQKEIIEWHWNLNQLGRATHRWKAQQWISSGFDEPEAQRVRSETFQRACRQKSFGSADWLRRLHRSHSPNCGPFSTCMHRTEAATVSYTEISIAGGHIQLSYACGAPCNPKQTKTTCV